MPRTEIDTVAVADKLRPALLRVGRELRRVRSRRTAWLASRLGGLTPDELAAVEAAVEPLSRLVEGRP